MIRICAAYCFVPLADPAEHAARLLELCEAEGIRGTLILAGEGFNGTVAGPGAGIDRLVEALRVLGADRRAEIKFADADAIPFGRLKVKVKPEIVTMGRPQCGDQVGQYVDPADWNALIANPATLVIDTRNSYEVGIGSFARARDPGTRSFTEFPGWLASLAATMGETERRERPIAMFCTGGIRCEKSTALARAMGFGNVHHLKGGILAYLEQVAEADSLWRGDCFVFDERVAVTHGLAPGAHRLCQTCGMPVRADEAEAHRAGCGGAPT